MVSAIIFHALDLCQQLLYPTVFIYFYGAVWLLLLQVREY